MKDSNKEEYRKIGARIKAVRCSKGMNQKELALKANVSISHMSEIESGKQSLMLSTFSKIVEALEVPADELLWEKQSEVNRYYSVAYRELLSDCSPEELASILAIVKSAKTQFRTLKSK